MATHIIGNHNTMGLFKKSNYFKINLGVSITIEENNKRKMNKTDLFSYYYWSIYKTTPLAQGNIGDIKIYVDHSIKEKEFAIYIGETFEEFPYTFDFNKYKEKGVDGYLGWLLKDSETKYDERIKKDELKKIELKEKEGDPDKVFKNPGSVDYSDLKAYLDKKRKNRRM